MLAYIPSSLCQKLSKYYPIKRGKLRLTNKPQKSSYRILSIIRALYYKTLSNIRCNQRSKKRIQDALKYKTHYNQNLNLEKVFQIFSSAH